MEYTVGQNVEAVDHLGVWAKAKVIQKRDTVIVVTFPLWKSEWNREIVDPSEVRKRSEEEVLVPRRFATNKSPNLNKLLAGDKVVVAGEDVLVHWSDPIRKSVTVKLQDGSTNEVNVWEVERAREEGQSEPTTKKRKRQSIKETHNYQQLCPQPQPGSQSPVTGVNESDSFEFCFYVEPNGTSVRVGSFYSLAFSGNSIFVCTSISKLAHQFTFKFVLCQLVNDKVESLLPAVLCSVSDVKQISHSSNITCSSKARNPVDNIICEGWGRVLRCQESNVGNVSYLLDLRKSCLAGQMRQGVWAGISRTATRPSQPIQLGMFDPMLDSKIFSLSSKNQFQVVYKGTDVAKLDSLLGALWDVKILEPGNPHSHFKYVCQVRLFVHKLSMSLRFNFSYSESNVPYTATYRSSCIY